MERSKGVHGSSRRDVQVDAEELGALRTMALRYLEGTAPARRAPFDPSEDLRWQELRLIQRLAASGGDVVPPDQLVEHVRDGLRARPGTWSKAPASQVSRARAKCRYIFGRECIATVWSTRVNRKGQVVRNVRAGIVGYRWIGPAIEGMTAAQLAALDLGAE